MDSVLRATAIYAILLVAFRIAGKRSLGQITTFDFVLLLVISEATQQGLLGDDFSVVNAAVVIATFIVLDLGMGWAKGRWPAVDAALDGLPVILVDNGRFLEDRARREGVDVSDVLTAGRELQGLERLDQIKYAVLERSGGISIVPKEEAR